MITAENILKFIKGELTWAQVEGITADEAASYMRMGVELAEREDFDGAVRVFECLIAINPKDANPYALLGSIQQRQGKAEEALKSYTAALAIDPRHVLALSGRGELRLHRSDAEGLRDLQRAAEIDPMGRTAAGRRACGMVRALAFQGAQGPRFAATAAR